MAVQPVLLEIVDFGREKSEGITPHAGQFNRLGLTARGASPTAFGRRCIPSGCVAPRSNIPDILTRRALPAGRIATLGATPDLHHGLLRAPEKITTEAQRHREAPHRNYQLGIRN